MPFSRLETAVRIDPDRFDGEPLARLDEELGHFLDSRKVWCVDVEDTQSHLVGIAIGSKCLKQLHLRPRGLDGDHIGIRRNDGAEDVVGRGIALVGVDLRFVRYAGRGEAKALHGQVIGFPLGFAQRQTVVDSRLVDLNDVDARALEIDHLVAQRERDLVAGLSAGPIVTYKRPLHGDGTGQHAAHRPSRQRPRIGRPFHFHRFRAGHIVTLMDMPYLSCRLTSWNAACGMTR
jgi:hypothetical protein